MMQLESKSFRVPPKSNDPLWETKFDTASHEEYWVDIETGKVCFIRPEKGTFVSELPLQDFRKVPKRTLSLPATVSIRSQSRKSKLEISSRDEDIEAVIKEDITFEDLANGNKARDFDAGALLGVGK